MRVNLRITIVLAAGLLAALCLGGCDMESTTTPTPGDDAASVWPKPFIVTDSHGLALIEASDSLLIFDLLGNPPAIAPGRTFVGTGGDGYLRKLLSSRLDGRRLYLATAPAYLADMVMFGGVDTTMQIGFGSSAARVSATESGPGGDIRLAPGVSLAGGGINLTEVVLYQGEVGGARVRVVIHNGRIVFNPLLDLEVRIRGYGAAEYGATGYGFLDLSFRGDLQCNAAVSFEHELPVASLTRRFVQYIDEVPVVETVTLTYVAGFRMRTGSAGTNLMEASGAGDVELGAKYVNRAWTSVNESSFRWSAHEFLYDSPSEGEIEMYLSPRLTVHLYDLPCCRLEWTSCLRLIEQDVGFPVLDWVLIGLQDAEMEFEGACSDRAVPRFDPLLLTGSGILARGPFRTDEYVFVGEWGGEGRADGKFGYPKGIAVDRDGYVYVVDSWNSRVQKFTRDGEFVLRWGSSGTAPGQFDAPEGIALDGAGNVYVVDGGNNRIQKFGPDTTLISTWGAEGSGDGEFRAPVGIAISGADLYVTDNLNNRVQRFSLDGDYAGSWGGAGSGSGLLDGPMGIAAASSTGHVFVTDCGNSRLQMFDSDGRYLGEWGSLGDGDEQFNCPVGATIYWNAIWVTDIGNDRIVKYSLSGDFLLKLGSHGFGQGQFDHPEGMAGDPEGNLYVVDGRNRRIQKFAPLIGLSGIAPRPPARD